MGVRTSYWRHFRAPPSKMTSSKTWGTFLDPHCGGGARWRPFRFRSPSLNDLICGIKQQIIIYCFYALNHIYTSGGLPCITVLFNITVKVIIHSTKWCLNKPCTRPSTHGLYWHSTNDTYDTSVGSIGSSSTGTKISDTYSDRSNSHIPSGWRNISNGISIQYHRGVAKFIKHTTPIYVHPKQFIVLRINNATCYRIIPGNFHQM